MSILIRWTDTNSIEDGHRIYRSSSPMDPEALPAPLAEVAAAHGFYDQSHLVREFRRETGLTPRAYRQRYAAQGISLDT